MQYYTKNYERAIRFMLSSKRMSGTFLIPDILF